ncbi:hypothetical protein D3C72_2090640 [compost metagenome]
MTGRINHMAVRSVQVTNSTSTYTVMARGRKVMRPRKKYWDRRFMGVCAGQGAPRAQMRASIAAGTPGVCVSRPACKR